MNPKPDFDGARRYALGRLESDLSPRYHYHNLFHTRDDTAPAAERLARMEGISLDGLQLLLTAVYFHDIGFTISPDGHEYLSAQIARQELPQFGYTTAQIAIIQDCILATRLFTPPTTQLEAIIIDADLDVLGRDDFMARNRALRREQAELGRYWTDEQWYTQQLTFLQAHQYRTPSARSYRGPKKEDNIRLLITLLSRCQHHPVVSGNNIALPVRFGKD